MKPSSRLLLIIMIAMFSNLTTMAKELRKSYRGFVEWNTEIGWEDAMRYVGNESYEFVTNPYCLYGLSTSHGRQFNPHLFIGAGVWFQRISGRVYNYIPFNLPIFVHGRTDWTFGKMPVYADVRVGYMFSGASHSSFYGEDKVFVAPTIGYRLDWGRRLSANFGLGMALHGYSGFQGILHLNLKALPSIRIGIEL